MPLFCEKLIFHNIIGSIKCKFEIITHSNLTSSIFITSTDDVKMKFYTYFVLSFTSISYVRPLQFDHITSFVCAKVY